MRLDCGVTACTYTSTGGSGSDVVARCRTLVTSGSESDAAAVCGASPGGCTPGPSQKHPPVILITLDTVRSDHLGSYGYTRPTSPNLDAFAQGATLYRRAKATALVR